VVHLRRFPDIAMNQTSLATPDLHQSLVDLFAGWLAVAPGDYSVVPAAEMPEPFRGLLIHHRHMTEVLQGHYGEPVHLAVQLSEASEATYRRRITLTAGPGGPLVELGAVRLDLSVLPGPVQSEILAQSTPLGRILINHKILRRVVPHYYVHLHAHSPIVQLFNLPVPATLYGRIATIFCNEQPAIELLEIVTGNPRRNA
jgi:hypothetical protein